MPVSKINIFGDRLRRLRLQKGWTQQILADHASLSRDSIVDLEHGYADPTLNTLKKLAQALEISVSDLLDGV